MNKIKSFCVTIYHTAALCAIGFVSWKIIKNWHSGTGEKAGRSFDASIGATAVNPEKEAITPDTLSDKGMSENLGKGIDTVLTDSKKSIEKAANLVKRALKH